MTLCNSLEPAAQHCGRRALVTPTYTYLKQKERNVRERNFIKFRHNFITRVTGCTERDCCKGYRMYRKGIAVRVTGCTEMDYSLFTLHRISVNLSIPTCETNSKYYPTNIGKYFDHNHLFRPFPILSRCLLRTSASH